jgi:hypothetical protein
MSTRNLSFQGEPTLEELTEWALRYLESHNSIVVLDQFMTDMMSEYKLTNGNTVTPVKAAIANKGYYIFYMPMITFIYNPKSPKLVL